MVTRRTLLEVDGVVGVPAAVGAGVWVFPVRPHLYDLRLDNRRNETVNIDMRLDADDTTVLESMPNSSSKSCTLFLSGVGANQSSTE